MSLNSTNLTGIGYPISSYLCNAKEDSGFFCSDIVVPVWGKTIHMNDNLEHLEFHKA